jgi:hypothetical protein
MKIRWTNGKGKRVDTVESIKAKGAADENDDCDDWDTVGIGKGNDDWDGNDDVATLKQSISISKSTGDERLNKLIKERNNRHGVVVLLLRIVNCWDMFVVREE